MHTKTSVNTFFDIGVQTLLDGVISYLPDPSLKNESALNIENKNERIMPVRYSCATETRCKFTISCISI